MKEWIRGKGVGGKTSVNEDSRLIIRNHKLVGTEFMSTLKLHRDVCNVNDLELP